jgi:hypothetical protein
MFHRIIVTTLFQEHVPVSRYIHPNPLWSVNQPQELVVNERSSQGNYYPQRSLNFFFTTARTCYCSEQKIFLHDLTTARHLKSFFCNIHNKNIYSEN